MDMKSIIQGARELMKAKRFEEARKIYEELLEKNPSAVPAYVGIGTIHAMRGEFEQALEYYEGALHIQKDQPAALLLSGNVYMQQGLFDKALEKYKDAQEVNPNLGAAQVGIGRIYAKMGKYPEAIDCLREALRQNPQLEDARLTLAGIFQRQGDSDSALKEISLVVSNNPDSWRAQSQYANLLTARGEFKKAIDACKKALALQPMSAQLHQLMGGAYAELGEHELAIREFNRASELDENHIPAKIGVAKIYMKQGNLGEAKKILITLTTGVRFLGAVHRLLAELFMQEQAYTSAVEEFRAAIINSKGLTEKHPEFSKIEMTPCDDRQCAEAYKLAFEKIGAERLMELDVVRPGQLTDFNSTM